MKMFFSRCWWRWSRRRRGLQNQKLGRNQGVLYKTTDAPPLIALVLLLAVAGSRIGMGQPVILLIVGMRLTPLPPAVADHLSVFRIRQTLLTAILVMPLGLTPRPTTDGLVGTVLGRLEGLLAIRAAAWRENHFLRGMFGAQP